MPGVILEPLAGCIKWPPAKGKLAMIDTESDNGDYDHPVVVLTYQPQDGRVDISILGASLRYMPTLREVSTQSGRLPSTCLQVLM
jgi:hypothetical protein